MFDIWMRMLLQGNPVAWFALILTLVVAILIVFDVFLWLKLPAPAKKMFINNITAGDSTIAIAYPDHKIRYEIQKLYREGFTFNPKNHEWHVLPRLKTELKENFTLDEQEVFTKPFQVDGSKGAFYFACSEKGAIITPNLLDTLEHSDWYEDKDKRVLVNRKALINVLSRLNDEDIVIKPVNITRFVDPTKIKEHISDVWFKSALLSLEMKVKELYMRFGGGFGNILPLLIVIVIVLQVIGLVKSFGYI